MVYRKPVGTPARVAPSLLLLCFALGVGSTTQETEPAEAAGLPYDAMAEQIVASLQVEEGERVLLRFDPATLPELEPEVRNQLEQAGAQVETLNYGAAPELAERLEETDAYIWLPAGPDAPTPADQRATLAHWLEAGRGRQIHFHWADGTRDADGANGTHSPAYDRVYVDALDIDYAELDRQMEEAIGKLRAGEVRVTTPAGTDIRFRVGERPFCKQNGDASRARLATARILIEREIELPAGALRVAPLEDSVEGSIVIPRARMGGAEVEGIRLNFHEGVVTSATAEKNQDALERELEANPALNHFREFALGFNPKLVTPEGERWVAYYGYGGGVVRLSLGDNTELGGNVRGGAVRWFFFPDATVRAGDAVLAEAGRIALH